MTRAVFWIALPAMKCGTNNCVSDDCEPRQVLRPEIPYNQFDRAFGTTGGSVPAYNLSSDLGTMYTNHPYSTTVPVASGSQSHGTRLVLNALFEARCVTGP